MDDNKEGNEETFDNEMTYIVKSKNGFAKEVSLNSILKEKIKDNTKMLVETFKNIKMAKPLLDTKKVIIKQIYVRKIKVELRKLVIDFLEKESWAKRNFIINCNNLELLEFLARIDVRNTIEEKDYKAYSKLAVERYNEIKARI